MPTYRLIVITGEADHAGTGADVWVTLFSPSEISGERFIDNAEDNFERVKTDKFPIDCRDLVKLQQWYVRHYNSGDHPGWLLDRIVANNEANGRPLDVPVQSLACRP